MRRTGGGRSLGVPFRFSIRAFAKAAATRDAAPVWGRRGGSAKRPPDTTGWPETTK